MGIHSEALRRGQDLDVTQAQHLYNVQQIQWGVISIEIFLESVKLLLTQFKSFISKDPKDRLRKHRIA